MRKVILRTIENQWEWDKSRTKVRTQVSMIFDEWIKLYIGIYVYIYVYFVLQKLVQ